MISTPFIRVLAYYTSVTFLQTFCSPVPRIDAMPTMKNQRETQEMASIIALTGQEEVEPIKVSILRGKISS